MKPTKTGIEGETAKEIRNEVLAVLRPYENDYGAENILGLLAYTVGQMAACMDSTKYTSEMITNLIMTNMLNGNQFAMDQIIKENGGRN